MNTEKFNRRDNVHASKVGEAEHSAKKIIAAEPAHNYGQPVIRKEPKVGRNVQCPCDSGKKYKKCCNGR